MYLSSSPVGADICSKAANACVRARSLARVCVCMFFELGVCSTVIKRYMEHVCVNSDKEIQKGRAHCERIALYILSNLKHYDFRHSIRNACFFN